MATNDYSKAIAAEVRAEMARQQKSGTELAKRLHVTQSTLSRRLTGEVSFDLVQLFTVATWLGLAVSDLTSAADRLPAAASA